MTRLASFVLMIVALTTVPASAAPPPMAEPGLFVEPLGFPEWRGANYRQSARRQAKSGARWVRIQVDWRFLEGAGPGVIPAEHLAAYDHQVRQANRYGLRVMMTIGNGRVPAWSENFAAVELPNASPEEFLDYAAFARFLADRYQAFGVHHYELWNEPNLTDFWDHPSAVEYARLLRVTYPAIKQADPEAVVIAGSLAQERGINRPDRFLRGMYAADAAGHFDALSYHSYPAGSPKRCKREDGRAVSLRSFCFIERIREVQTAENDLKPIWITEFGYGTAGRKSVGLADQARYLVNGFRATRDYPYIPVMIWFSFRDILPTDARPQKAWWHHSGIVYDDLEPKPSYRAYRQVARSSP